MYRVLSLAMSLCFVAVMVHVFNPQFGRCVKFGKHAFSNFYFKIELCYKCFDDKRHSDDVIYVK